MMDRKSFYEALEAMGDGGEALVKFAKGEFEKIGEKDKNYRDTKKSLDSLESDFAKYKDILEVISSERLNKDSLNNIITKSREDESQIDKVQRELEILSSKYETSQSDIKQRDVQLAEANRDKVNTTLKEVFTKALPNVNAKILDKHLKLEIAEGNLAMDENGEPVGKYNNTYLNPKTYAEQFIKDNPEFLNTKSGPGSKQTNGHVSNDSGHGDKSMNELIAEGMQDLMGE